MPLNENIHWAFAVDYYIATIGWGLTLATRLAAKRGIAHSEQGHLNQMEFWPEVRADAPAPISPNRASVEDIGQGMYCNYRIEPTVMIGLFEKLLGSSIGVNAAAAWRGHAVVYDVAPRQIGRLPCPPPEHGPLHPTPSRLPVSSARHISGIGWFPAFL